jgi:hypothetical protein
MSDTTAPSCPVCNGSLQHVIGWKTWGTPLYRVLVCLGCGSALDRLANPMRALTQRELRAFEPNDAARLHKAQTTIRGNGRVM